MDRFKAKLVCGFVCLLLSLQCPASASNGYMPPNLQFLHNYLQQKDPFDFEYSLHVKYFERVNMTKDYMKLQEYGQPLGIAFQQQWRQIKRGIDATSRGLDCYQQLEALVAGIGNNELTSYKYFDAWGKFPSGILKGHLTDLGNFDECVEMNELLANTTRIVGRYCFVTLPLTESTALGASLNINIAVCMPAICSAEEFDNFYKLFLNNILNVTIDPQMNLVNDETCKTGETPEFQASNWFAVAVLCILATAMAFSSLYEFFTKLNGVTPAPLLCSFSVQSNIAQLLLVVPNTKSPNVIPCLNGIRCLSLVWVIAAHTVSFHVKKPFINSFDILPWSHTAYSMIYQQSLVSVDSFLFLSGLLVSFIALREMDRTKGKLNVPMMYLHRILRLTPMVALTILVTSELFNNWGTGPIWEKFNKLQVHCRDNWWTTLLYINNYVKPNDMCIGQTWYLSVDMQLYILSPIFLFMLYRWRRKGVAVIIALCLLLVACLFTTIFNNDYRFHTNGTFRSGPNVLVKTYYPTHVRASPWLIGLIFGYYLHNNKHKRISLPKFVVLLGWLTALALMFGLIFAWYPRVQENAAPITILEEALYYSLSHIAWSLALCWLVFACIQGYGGPINSFLSCPLWQPLAKLSFCMYLWHLYIIFFNAGLVKTDSYFSSWNLTLAFWSDFGWTLLISIVMYLAFEIPLVNIQNILLPKRKKNITNLTTQSPLAEAEHANEEVSLSRAKFPAISETVNEHTK